MLVCLIEIAIKESIFHGYKSCLDMKRVYFTLQTYHHIQLIPISDVLPKAYRHQDDPPHLCPPPSTVSMSLAFLEVLDG
jgi:hypothetical protein